MLKGQRLDNKEDSEMPDVIRSSVRYEFCSMIGLNDIPSLASTMFGKPSTATSTFKRSEKKLQKQLDDYYAKIIMLDAKNKKDAE